MKIEKLDYSITRMKQEMALKILIDKINEIIEIIEFINSLEIEKIEEGEE